MTLGARCRWFGELWMGRGVERGNKVLWISNLEFGNGWGLAEWEPSRGRFCCWMWCEKWSECEWGSRPTPSQQQQPILQISFSSTLCTKASSSSKQNIPPFLVLRTWLTLSNIYIRLLHSPLQPTQYIRYTSSYKTISVFRDKHPKLQFFNNDENSSGLKLKQFYFQAMIQYFISLLASSLQWKIISSLEIPLTFWPPPWNTGESTVTTQHLYLLSLESVLIAYLLCLFR